MSGVTCNWWSYQDRIYKTSCVFVVYVSEEDTGGGSASVMIE